MRRICLLIGLALCWATVAFGQTQGPATNLAPTTVANREATPNDWQLITREKAPGAPTVALAGAGPGNASNGVHRCRVALTSAAGHTQGGTISATVTVTDNTVNGQIAISNIPTGSSFITGRTVYCTTAGGSVYRLLSNGVIANNSATTLTMNDSDATLLASTVLPNSNTTANQIIGYDGPTGAITIGGGAIGAGDVVGPASATDNAIVRYNLTTGKLVQDSGIIISDSNGLNCSTDGGCDIGNGLADFRDLSLKRNLVLRGSTSGTAILGATVAAKFRFGDVDAASPVAQTLSVQNVVAGTSNTAGANFTIAGSQGTGTGIGGSLIFQVAPAGGSGSSQNALATALTIASTKDATFTGLTQSTGVGVNTAATAVALVNASDAANGNRNMQVTNTTDGTAATAHFRSVSSTTTAEFGSTAPLKTTYGALTGASAYIYTASDITLMADAAGKVVKFAAGGNTERARFDGVGNFKLAGTAVRGTTEGTNHIDIFDGTAPVGTLANGISIYSAAGEGFMMDAAGNATLQTPHDRITNEWIFYSKNTRTGKVLRIDMERMMRALDKQLGGGFVHEFASEIEARPDLTVKP